MNRQITEFIKHHFRHINSAALIDAAEGYTQHLKGGGKMKITLAVAMSTAELGLILAGMIFEKKPNELPTTSANVASRLIRSRSPAMSALTKRSRPFFATNYTNSTNMDISGSCFFV